MRRIVLALLGITVPGTVEGGLLLGVFVDEDRIMAFAAATLQEQTGAALTVRGEKTLSLFPTLVISLADAAITLPQSTEPDLTAGKLDIGAQLPPLISRDIVIDRFRLGQLDVTIEQARSAEKLETETLSDANLNAFYAQKRREREAAGEAAGAHAALTLPLALNVGQLVVTNARLQRVDSGEVTRVTVDQLSASALNLDGEAIPVKMNLTLAGEQPIKVSLDGDIAIALPEQTARLEGADAGGGPRFRHAALCRL